MSENDENNTKNAGKSANLGESMTPKTTDTSKKTTKKSSKAGAAAKKTAGSPDETTSTAANKTTGATKTAGASAKAANKTTSTTTKTTKAAGVSKTTAAKNATVKTSTVAKSTKTTSVKPAKAAEPTKAAVAAKMPKASTVSAVKIDKSTASTVAEIAKQAASTTAKPEKLTSGLATKTAKKTTGTSAKTTKTPTTVAAKAASKPAKKDETVIEKEVNVNGKPVSILLPSQAGNNPNDGMNINLTINLAGEEKKRRATTTTKRTSATTKTTSQATKTAPKAKASDVKPQKTETQAKKVETPAKPTEAQVSEVVLKKSKKKKKSPWWLLLILVLLLAAAVCVAVVVLPRDDAHTHTYSETWSTDESDHWHKCTGCDSVKDKASHAYGNACDTDCNVCGFTRTPPHAYEYKNNDTTHWQDCSVCHTITTAQPHTFESGKCTVCDFVEVTQGLKYEFVSGETVETPFYRVIGYKDGETPVKHVKIPATYNDGTNGECPVLEVIGHAFTYETTMESVIFAGDIEIADGFYGCENLESVTFCGTVKKIGAFGDTPKLTSITFPEGLKEIEETAFAFSGLTSVNIPASVEILGGNPFMGCENLTTITVDNANENYYVLNNFLIDRANKKIVTGLTFSNIPSNSEIATTIGEYAFGVVAETTLKIPSNITTIEGHAFYVSFLTSAELPNGLSEIREYLFSYCISLTKIVIPESVTTIYRSAFDNCTAVTTIYYGGDAIDWAQIQYVGSYYNNSLETATVYYYSENMPQELSVNAWRYVDGVPTAWPAHTAHAYDNACDTDCNVCGLTRTTTHSYGTTYEKDETNHWHECSCGDKKDTATHTFKNGICEICGYEREELAFSYVSATSSYKVTGIGRITGTEITIPATYDDGTNGEHQVASVEMAAFYQNASITSVTFAGDIKTLGTGCFNDCENLERVTFLGDVELIGGSCFMQCEKLATATFSGSVTKINSTSFARCPLLTSITLPEGLEEIGTLAFGMSGLTSINIPASVETISDNPFAFCAGLTSITVDSDSTNFKVIDGCLINIANKTLITGLDLSKIPTSSDDVTEIGTFAFVGSTGLTRLVIPNNITGIGQEAFELCSSITSVELPSGVTQIGAGVFANCENLTSAVIPSAVTSIDKSIFDGSANFTTIYYCGASSTDWLGISFCYTEIGYTDNSDLFDAEAIYYYSESMPQELSVNAWRYVDGVPTVWPAHTAHSYVYKNNDTSHWQDCSVCHAIATSETHVFVDGKCTCAYVEETQNLVYSFVAGATEEVSYYEVAGLGTATAKHIKIPATYNDGVNGEHPVKSVAKDAFQATSTTSAETTLLSITFLDNMETIEEYAFSGCISLTSVIFSSTITKIDACAFAVCSTLTNITLPNGLKEIGTLAFSFTGLTSVNIPASVETIGDNPFMFCENLNAITVNSESTNFQIINSCLVDIVNKQIIIGLDYSNIPTNSEKVTKIGNSAFANLTGVAHLKIPSNITSIGDAAFEFCGDIVSVEIPVELAEIIKYAFDSCEKLTTVYYAGTQSQWEAIAIAVSGNSEIINATRYYYSENEPTTTGNYWHYVEGVPTAWETTSGGE